MFFVLSKLFWSVVAPSTFLVLLGLVGLVLSLRWRRPGLLLAAFGLVTLLLATATPLAQLVLAPLENRFPAFVDDGRPIDGIIVLGGSELPPIAASRGQPSFNDAGERMLALGELARRYPNARLAFSGGSGLLGGPVGQREAETIRQALPAVDGPPERMTFEDRSRNTQENARFSRALLQPRPGERWLLVTSAFHMPRAVGCFRAAGFPVIAYPVDYRTVQWGDWRAMWVAGGGTPMLDLAVKEWIGLAVYYLSGRTDALFPAPADTSR